MQSLFPEGNPKRCAIKRSVSIAAQLQVSLNAMLKGLTSRQLHYIRCLKPNELKQPKIFELALVQHQVLLHFYMKSIIFYHSCRFDIWD